MKSIIVISEIGAFIYSSVGEAAKHTGISRTRISRALNHHSYGLIQNTNPPVCVELFDETLATKPDNLPCKACMTCPHLRRRDD